jgi:hypothetical protein
MLDEEMAGPNLVGSSARGISSAVSPSVAVVIGGGEVGRRAGEGSDLVGCHAGGRLPYGRPRRGLVEVGERARVGELDDPVGLEGGRQEKR